MENVFAYKKVALSREQIVKKYSRLRKKYKKYVSSNNEVFLALFFSIMIIENYNRPWYLRWLEFIVFMFKKIFYKEAIMTLGIMQMKTSVLIGNVKSIRLAEEFIQKEINKHYFSSVEEMISCIALKYNPSQLYREEISRIYHYVAWVK